MNHPNSLLDTLGRSKIYQDYERAFGDATGLPLTLRSSEAWQVAQQHSPQRNPFCAMMARQSRSCAACLQVQQELTEKCRDNPATVQCFAGLVDTAVPVKLGQETIGYLQTGQIMFRKPNPRQFKRVTRQLSDWGLEFQSDELEQAWMNSRVLTNRQYDAAVQLLGVFAEHLSIASNQIAVQQANAEPPAITRAKKFIADHQTETLSLGQVAKAVNMSSFYFCKMFKKATGLNFTDYVSRVRVERARNLLLNPNLRVSEIAYEVGFQSLTHFNRVFRRIVGKSPTAYRGKLVAA
jgi:AraC-like DNA-binding protein